MITDRERLELIQIFLANVTQIEQLDEMLKETKATIKRQKDQLLADNDSILERLRDREDRQSDLPFQASPEPPEPEPEDEEEENKEEEEDDEDLEVDVLIEQVPGSQEGDVA